LAGSCGAEHILGDTGAGDTEHRIERNAQVRQIAGWTTDHHGGRARPQPQPRQHVLVTDRQVIERVRRTGDYDVALACDEHVHATVGHYAYRWKCRT
jgi:hypothetical protein